MSRSSGSSFYGRCRTNRAQNVKTRIEHSAVGDQPLNEFDRYFTQLSNRNREEPPSKRSHHHHHHEGGSSRAIGLASLTTIDKTLKKTRGEKVGKTSSSSKDAAHKPPPEGVTEQMLLDYLHSKEKSITSKSSALVQSVSATAQHEGLVNKTLNLQEELDEVIHVLHQVVSEMLVDRQMILKQLKIYKRESRARKEMEERKNRGKLFGKSGFFDRFWKSFREASKPSSDREDIESRKKAKSPHNHQNLHHHQHRHHRREARATSRSRMRSLDRSTSRHHHRRKSSLERSRRTNQTSRRSHNSSKHMRRSPSRHHHHHHHRSSRHHSRSY